MRKQVEESPAAESARRATGAAAERDRRGRFSARRKRATVLRLLRGEDLESVSRELGITAAWASQWRDQFLAAGQAGLKSRAPDARDEEPQRLYAKVGELLRENELLYAKVDHLEAGGPLARRRSTRGVAPSRSPPVRLEFPIFSLNPGLRQRCVAPGVWPPPTRYAATRESNEERPKQGLGGLTPAQYAKRLVAERSTVTLGL